MLFEEKLAARQDAAILPTCDLVETLRTGMSSGGKPQSLQTTRPQPVDHFVVQTPAMTSGFVLWFYKERPDVAGVGVADGESDNASVALDDPPSAAPLDGDDDLFVRDDGGREAVLLDSMANTLDLENIYPNGLAERCCHR